MGIEKSKQLGDLAKKYLRETYQFEAINFQIVLADCFAIKSFGLKYDRIVVGGAWPENRLGDLYDILNDDGEFVVRAIFIIFCCLLWHDLRTY